MRVKLKHNYHDALIRSVRYEDESNVMVDVDLCGSCNGSPGPATICVTGVRNFAVVRGLLDSAKASNASKGSVDEIIAVLRAEKRGYLIHLMTAGAVYFDARDLHEA